MKSRLSRRRPSIIVCALLAALVASSARDARADGSERPNILLLVAEDLGPRVGAFGDPVAVTPHIDRLAAEGVRYPNTFTAAGVCAPSRAALVTGRHPNSIGAGHMRTSTHPSRPYTAVPPPEVKAFPELLRRAGYFTYTGLKLDYQFSGVRAGSGPFTIWDDEGFGTGWEEGPDDRPFFGLVNFQVTHESALFPRGGFPRSFVHAVFQLLYLWEFWGHESVTDPADVRVPPYYPDTPTARATLARHYDNVHRMDEQVGEILARLEADGLADSTIVVWTTDHGDGLPRAKRELYDSGIRVPLVVRWPEALRPADATPGSVDERLVSFVDLAPTILSWADVTAPDWMHGRVFAGPAAGAPRRYVYAARDRVDERPDRVRALRDSRFEYIRNYHPDDPGALPLEFRDHLDLMRELWALHEAGALDPPAERWFAAPRPREELYDTARDPHEVENLAGDPEHADRLGAMRAALDDWLARVPDLGAIPEDELIDRFWPNGEQPVTATPELRIERAGEAWRVHATCASEGASIAYRVRPRDDDRGWTLYTGPVSLRAGQTLEAAAVRYGWARSEAALQTAPE